MPGPALDQEEDVQDTPIDDTPMGGSGDSDDGDSSSGGGGSGTWGKNDDEAYQKEYDKQQKEKGHGGNKSDSSSGTSGDGSKQSPQSSAPKGSTGGSTPQSSAGGKGTPSGGAGSQGSGAGGSTAQAAQQLGSKLKDQAGKSSGSNSENPSEESGGQKAANAAGEAADSGQRLGRMAAGDESAAKDYAMDAAQGAIEAAKTGDLKKGFEVGTKKIRQDLKWVFIVAVIAVAIIIIPMTVLIMAVACILGGCDGDAYGNPSQQSTLSLTMNATPSDTASAGQAITYTIAVTSTTPTTSIVVNDPVPENTSFLPADNKNNNIIEQCPGTTPTDPNQNTSGKGLYCDIDKTVTWKLIGSTTASADAPFETSVTVTFRVNSGVNNIKIFNIAHADSQEGTTTDTDTTNTDNPDNTDLQVGP